MPKSKSYPFPYLGHGSAFAEKGAEALIWFEAPVPAAGRKAIEAGLPQPLATTKRWGSVWLHIGSDDAYPSHVIDWLRPGAPSRRARPTPGEWKKAEALIERWIRELHARHPVAFFYKTNDAETRSAWHGWSLGVFEERVLPRLERARGDKKAHALARWVKEAWADEAAPSARKPDEKMTLGELRLSIAAGNYPTARKIGRQYRAAGGDMSPAILSLLVVIHNFANEPKKDLVFFQQALDLMFASKKNRYRSHLELVTNVCWVLNAHERFDEVLELVEAFPAPLTDLLEDRRLYAALNARKHDLMKRYAADVMALHAKRPRFFRESPTTLFCAAYAFAALGDKKRMLQALRAAKALGCEVRGARKEADFRAYKNDSDFLAVVG
jgi:hypothetical protein